MSDPEREDEGVPPYTYVDSENGGDDSGDEGSQGGDGSLEGEKQAAPSCADGFVVVGDGGDSTGKLSWAEEADVTDSDDDGELSEEDDDGAAAWAGWHGGGLKLEQPTSPPLHRGGRATTKRRGGKQPTQGRRSRGGGPPHGQGPKGPPPRGSAANPQQKQDDGGPSKKASGSSAPRKPQGGGEQQQLQFGSVKTKRSASGQGQKPEPAAAPASQPLPQNPTPPPPGLAPPQQQAPQQMMQQQGMQQPYSPQQQTYPMEIVALLKNADTLLLMSSPPKIQEDLLAMVMQRATMQQAGMTNQSVVQTALTGQHCPVLYDLLCDIDNALREMFPYTTVPQQQPWSRTMSDRYGQLCCRLYPQG